MDDRDFDRATGLKFDRMTLCFVCPSNAMQQPTADIRAMSPAYRACRSHVAKIGIRELRRIADKAQADIITIKQYAIKMKCEMCGAPRYEAPPKGIYCDTCRAEYRAKFGKECPV